MVTALVKRYVIAVGRYKWAGLASVLAVFGASGVVALQPPPEQLYQADGLLVQNDPLVVITQTGTAIQEQGQGVITEDFLLSDILLDQVVQRLEEEGIALTSQDIKDNTTISIGDDGGQRVAVRLVLEDPETAEQTLGLMFEGMVEFSRFNNQARLRAIVEALNERLVPVEADLRTAEQTLEQYDRIEGPAIQNALDGSLLNAISGSQNQQRQNEITLEGIDAQIRSLEGRLGLTADEAYASSALSADPIIANLRSQIYEVETQIELLSFELRDAHPTMIELREDLVGFEQLLSQRASEVIGGGGDTVALPSGNAVRQDSNLDPARAALANQLIGLQTQRDTLTQQQQTLARTQDELRQQYANLPNKQLQRERLAQQVGLKKALFDQLQARRIDAESAEAETVSSLTVSRPPEVKPAPRQVPNPFVVLGAGAALGVVAGAIIVFLLDLLDSTARTSEELTSILRDLEVSTLGVIPEIKTRSPRVPPLLLQPNMPFEESYEQLRSNIRLAQSGVLEEGQSPRVVLITSTKPREGKTVTAYNLAIASARAGRRTLLLEADLRSPSRASWLGIELDRNITVEPLRHYGGKLAEPIQLVPEIENLYLCPSPGPQRQSALLLESSEMQRLIDDARVRFDMVVIDGSPLGSNNDAKLIEPLTDGMLLVTRPGVTEKSILSAMLEQLEESEDIELLGAVINGADGSVEQSYAEAAEEDSSEDDDDVPPPPIDTPARKVPVSRVEF
ncbi:MAG: cobalamin biosynthesis protein CobQ [Cyanobacteria bacterium P01_H01_bin.119]